jgi:hypothetical protein
MDWIEDFGGAAAEHFWRVRDGGAGVQGGKTMDGYVELLKRVIEESGLEGVEIETEAHGKAALPGFFRAAKNWDFVAVKDGKLLAAIEFKSQVGSVGNNGNNRIEESLGSAHDLQTAIEESGLKESPNVFVGYLMVIEGSADFHKCPAIRMKHFEPLNEFLLKDDEGNYLPSKISKSGVTSFQGISYASRYDQLCRRTMSHRLYDGACVVVLNQTDGSEREFDFVTAETSLQKFLLKFSKHFEVVRDVAKLG